MHFYSFRAAMLARNDSNSGQRHFQTRSQQVAQRFVGTIIDWRRRKANFQPFLVLADDFIAARARLDTNRKAYPVVSLADLHFGVGTKSARCISI